MSKEEMLEMAKLARKYILHVSEKLGKDDNDIYLKLDEKYNMLYPVEVEDNFADAFYIHNIDGFDIPIFNITIGDVE